MVEPLMFFAAAEPSTVPEDRIIAGLLLIRKYEAQASLACEHDALYYGTYKTTYARMSEEERVAMQAWGWFEEWDSWCHYT